MKLSVAIASETASASAFVVWRGFEPSIKKASELGFDGVELALKTAADIDMTMLSKWLCQYRLDVSCISTGQVFSDLNLYFTHHDIQIRQKVIEVFSDLIHIAKDFGKRINIGRVRGFIAQGQTYEQTELLFIDTAKRIAEIAQKSQVLVVLEPVNRYELNFINNLDQGARLISKLNCENIGLMPDVFHMNIEDDKIGNSIRRNGSLVKYMHFADSNRLAPGQGHLNFDEVFNALSDINYDGWAAIEILPSPSPDTAAMQAAQFILPYVKSYNEGINK